MKGLFEKTNKRKVVKWVVISLLTVLFVFLSHINLQKPPVSTDQISEFLIEVTYAQEHIAGNDTEEETADDIGGIAVPDTDWWDVLKILATLPQKLPGIILGVILFVFFIIAWLAYLIGYFITFLSEMTIGMVLNPGFIQGLGGFTTAEFVREVARIVAQLCNMIYLFVLLYIAIRTIVSSSFNYKGLLVKLVFAALLTNFSLVIAGVIIDFSQVIMYSIKIDHFNIGTNILDEVQEKLKLNMGSEILDRLKEFTIEKSIIESLTEIYSMMLLVLFSFILAMTIGVYSILLIIRIIGLWILLILSPFAFLLSILPQTESYFKDWLSKLFNYAFLGPILVFCLWLTKKIATHFDKKAGSFGFTKGLSEDRQPGIGDKIMANAMELFTKNFEVVFKFLVLITILWAGVTIAQKFQIQFADNIGERWKSLLNGILRGSPIKGMKMATRTFFNMRIKGRKRKLDRLRAEGLTEKDTKVKKVKKSLERTKAWKDRATKISAATSPGAWKRRLATYWKETDEEHWGDMDRAMRSFGSTSLWGDKKHKANIAEKEMNRSTNTLKGLAMEQRTLERKKTTYPGFFSEEEGKRLEKVKERIGEIKEKIAETLFEDTAKQGHVKDKLGDEVNRIIGGYTPGQGYNIVQEAGENIDPNIIPPKDIRPEKDLLKKLLAKTRYDILSKPTKLETEEDIRKREKEIREKTKELDEKEVPGDELLERIERLEGSDVDKTVWLRKLATSDKSMGKFVNNLIDKYGTLKDALKELEDSFPEGELARAIRAAESSAKKSKNPVAIGHMRYNSTKNETEPTSKSQRVKKIKAEIQSTWSINDLGRFNTQMFGERGGKGDQESIKAFAESYNWEKVNTGLKVGDFRSNASQQTISDLNKYSNEIKNYLPSQTEKDAFDTFLGRVS